MYYTVYKITNVVNGKAYIGMHQTKKLDDGYMGSGKRLKLAFLKYGLENFTKEILHVFDNELDMRNKEKELVIVSENTYNLCDGGKGGFGYLNRSGLSSRLGKQHKEESKKLMGHPGNTFGLGRKLSEKTKQKIGSATSASLKGKTKTDDHKRKIAESVRRKHQERIMKESGCDVVVT